LWRNPIRKHFSVDVDGNISESSVKRVIKFLFFLFAFPFYLDIDHFFHNVLLSPGLWEATNLATLE